MVNEVSEVSSRATRAKPERPSTPQRSRRSCLRLAVYRGVLLLTSLCVGLILLEVGIRLCLPVYVPAKGVPVYLNEDNVPLAKKNLTSRLWASTNEFDTPVRINQYGFRDDKDIRNATEEDFFVLGDSFSFGWGVAEEDRYSNLLASQLGVDVYNISVPTHIVGYLKLLEYAHGNGATIRNLVIGVCMENDVNIYEGSVPYILQMPDGITFWHVKNFLSQHLASYNAIAHVAHKSTSLRSACVRLGLIHDGTNDLRGPAYSEALLQSTSAKLVELAERFPMQRVVVMLIPSRLLWREDERAAALHIHQGLVERLVAHNVQVVDLLPAMEADGDPMSCHFKYDGHWNEKGHRVAAAEISKALRADDSRKEATRLEDGPG